MAVTEQFGERSDAARPRWMHIKSAAFLSEISAFDRRFRNAIGVYLHAVQVARMNGVIANLSDVQLEQVGITRAEIPRYAERLISNDGVRRNDER
jgi:uncharacterized protein YjiS (DUF1127 family)